MEGFAGRTAVVTGAASGIGLGMVEALASRGMRVVMADVEADVLAAEAQRLVDANFDVLAHVTDVSVEAQVAGLLEAARAAFGNVHVLCNNAGVGGGGPGAIWEQSENAWDWVMGVNFDGVRYGLRVFVPHMLGHGEAGHIVNTSSIAGMMSGRGSIYGVSKHAVSILTEGLYLDLAERGANIGVTLLCPGIIDTHIIESGRNRPPRLADPEREPTAAQTDQLERLRAYFKRHGIAPREVGEMVARAIAERRFYLFTQEAYMAPIRQRFDAILEGRDPTPPRLPQ